MKSTAMRRSWRRGTVLGLTGAASLLGGCGGDVGPDEMLAMYYIGGAQGDAELQAVATYNAEAGDLDPGATTLRIGSAGQPLAGGDRWMSSHGAVPALASGERYEIALDLPSHPGISHSLRMPYPAELTAPAEDAEIRVTDDLEVTWTSDDTDDLEAVLLSTDAACGFSLMVGVWAYDGSATDGQAGEGDRFVIPAERLESWLSATVDAAQGCEPSQPVTFPLQIELTLVRTRTSSVVPPFDRGGARIAIAADSRLLTIADAPVAP